LKATTEPSIEAREVMTAAVEMLIATGAEAVILGCTELPLALPDPVLRDIPLVDPMRVLAGRLINA
jgi:aspartate racemase